MTVRGLWSFLKKNPAVAANRAFEPFGPPFGRGIAGARAAVDFPCSGAVLTDFLQIPRGVSLENKARCISRSLELDGLYMCLDGPKHPMKMRGKIFPEFRSIEKRNSIMEQIELDCFKVVGRYDSEGTCAWLASKEDEKKEFVVFTCDSDIIPLLSGFGDRDVRVVVFMSARKGSRFPDIVYPSRIFESLQVNDKEFKMACAIAGTDYTPGVPGYGFKRALEAAKAGEAGELLFLNTNLSTRSLLSLTMMKPSYYC